MIGVDEVGRGAWAGPLLVVAARRRQTLPAPLGDSKRLSHRRRERLALLLARCCDVGQGWVTVAELDELGLGQALRLAAGRALAAVGALPQERIVIDGRVNLAPANYRNVRMIVRADQSVPIVSAAAIVAKATRDAVMKQIASTYPDYGFDRHVGYGTVAHQLALKRLGPVPGVHRLRFRPLAGRQP